MKKLAPQERSRQMVDAILEASIRILKKNGKAFNTINVAEETGISVGSLYQYFPHKEAILFHLQARQYPLGTHR